MEQIEHNIFVETETLGSNNSMILTSEGILLIDSPHKPTDAIKWKREVESRGNVIYLVNTDHHIDHTMGNFFLGGKIISHKKTREKLAKEFPSLDSLKQLLSTIDPEGIALLSGYSPRLPTITMNDRMTLYLNEVTLELTHLEGHTPNSLVAYIPEQKVLFTGDNVCEGGLPSFREASLFYWFENLRRIMEMDVRFIVPGHGKTCTMEEVRAFYYQMKKLVERVKREITKGVPKSEIVNTIRFTDRIHTSTSLYQGYPEDKIEEIQRNSISRIYDQIVGVNV